MITFTGEPGCCGLRDPAGSWDFLAYGYTIIYRFSPLYSPGATGLSFASVCWVGSTSFLEAWFSTKHLAHFPQSFPLQGEVMINQISMEIKILPSLIEWSLHRPETEWDLGRDRYSWQLMFDNWTYCIQVYAQPKLVLENTRKMTISDEPS